MYKGNLGLEYHNFPVMEEGGWLSACHFSADRCRLFFRLRIPGQRRQIEHQALQSPTP